MEISRQFYRGIIHNHSACSKEGCYPLEVLRSRWAGLLHFAAMTEHAERTTAEAFAAYVEECDALSTEQFRFIPGLEVATQSGDMLLLGCRKFICTTDPFQVLREAEGCVILLAHPEKGKIIPAVLEQAHGIEVWNGGHMGGLMPPIDWIHAWRRFLPLQGKILTGGNDIHKIDPKRKILTLVPAQDQYITPISETDILHAISAGQFLSSNGIFSLTPAGQIYHHRGRFSAPPGGEETPAHGPYFAVLAQCYRAGWRSLNACLEVGAKVLATFGLDKQRRTSLNRLIRQHL